MGQGVSSACCGRERFDGEGKDAPMMPLRRISCLQDSRVHFINDAPMVCVVPRKHFQKGTYTVKDINRISLFQVESVAPELIRLLLPGGSCHATIERDPTNADEWHIYVGEARRVTVARRVVSNNTVFLVHALLEPYPRRGETVSLPLPTLSVRGDFERQDFWMFDCSDIHGRRVAHASPSGITQRVEQSAYVVDVAPGLDVALVIAVALTIEDAAARR